MSFDLRHNGQPVGTRFRVKPKRLGLRSIRTLATVAVVGILLSSTTQRAHAEPVTTTLLVIQGVAALGSLAASLRDRRADPARTAALQNREMLKDVHARLDRYDKVLAEILYRMDRLPDAIYSDMIRIHKRGHRNGIRALGDLIELDLRTVEEGGDAPVPVGMRIHTLQVLRAKLLDDLATEDPTSDDVRALVLAAVYELLLVTDSAHESHVHYYALSYFDAFRQLLPRVHDQVVAAKELMRREERALAARLANGRRQLNGLERHFDPSIRYKGTRRDHYGCELSFREYQWQYSDRVAKRFKEAVVESFGEVVAREARSVEEGIDMGMAPYLVELLSFADWASTWDGLLGHTGALAARFGFEFDAAAYPSPPAPGGREDRTARSYENRLSGIGETVTDYASRRPMAEVEVRVVIMPPRVGRFEQAAPCP